MTRTNLMSRRRRRALGAITILSSAVLSLGGCGKSADEYMRAAQAQLDAGRLPAAVIELKNVLQKEPKNLKARILLGQTYLDLFDPVSAETDLLRARADGADDLGTARPLAEAELALGKFDKALAATEFPKEATPQLKASLDAIRGLAYLGQGKVTSADEAFAAGLGEDARSVDVHTALTRYSLARRDAAAARDHLTQALAIGPVTPRLVSLKGSVALAEGNFLAAEEAFQDVVKAQPWNVSARTDLAQAQIAAGKTMEADVNLTAVLKAAPKAARPNYFRALTAFQAHDYKTARAHIQTVLGTAADNPPAQLLAGAIFYALNEFEQANSFLSQYVSRVPEDVRGRRLLGAVQLRLGRAADAVKTLSPAVAAGGDDAQLLALIGEAAARSGDAAGAEKYLGMAVEKQPDSATLRTELGLSKIALGQTDAAIEEFEKASKQDPAAVGPDAALIGTYLRDKNYDKALEIATNLQRKQSTSPLGFDFEGIIQFAKGDRVAAQVALVKAKELRPDDPTALRGLAALAVLEGKREVATEYYETLVRANPADTQAAIGLAQLQLDAANPEAARATLQKAVEQNGDDVAARVALSRLLVFQGKAREALDIVAPGLAKNPQQPEFLAIAGQAQLAAGRVDAALANFKQLVGVVPQSSEAHRNLAFAYSAAHDAAKAVDEATIAVQLAPADKAARIALGSLLIAANRLDEARSRTDEWAAAAAQDADFAELQGMVASAQNRPADAIAAYKRGMALLDNNTTRTRLALEQAKAGNHEEAQQLLRSWIIDHPDDVATRGALAQVYLAANRIAEARDQYAEILRQSPNNVAAENNLAWTMSVLGQKTEALDHARRAAAAAPDAPNVLDTLGVVLLQNGNAAEARDALEKAAKAAPNAAEIQFHLAQALKETGESERARTILQSILSGNQRFDEREQAQRLLDQLRG